MFSGAIVVAMGGGFGVGGVGFGGGGLFRFVGDGAMRHCNHDAVKRPNTTTTE